MNKNKHIYYKAKNLKLMKINNKMIILKWIFLRLKILTIKANNSNFNKETHNNWKI